MQAIKKLKENKIFGKNTIVESYIEKTLWGTPLYKKAFFLVKKANIRNGTDINNIIEFKISQG